MGRLARAVLREALADAALELTLLAERGRDGRALATEYPKARIRWPITAQLSGSYEAVWYPFNGMRFPCSAPSLVTMHDVFAFTEPHAERVARYREQAPIERAARHATRILTDSFWSRREIVRALGVSRERITVVHPAPDAFWFPKSGDVLPAPIADHKFALLVGVRERRKNARMALDACARAFAGSRDKMLVIVGELAPDDRAYARTLGFSCGEIAAGDALLRALYRKANVVLVPSLAEGFGMVAVEALACGAPVVAANAAALPEATDGAALLLDPRDVAGWARAIRELCDDDVRADAMRAGAVARFASSDRTRAARETLALLRHVAGNPS